MIFYKHPLIYALYPGDYKATDFANGGKRPKNRRNPSYIPRELFAIALMDLVSEGKAEGPVADAVRSLGNSVGSDVPRLRAAIEGWYDGAMDRVAG